VNLRLKLALLLGALHLLALWRVSWFPEDLQFSRADLGLFSVTILSAGNLLGPLLLAVFSRSSLLVLRSGTPYIETWYAVSLVGVSLLLGVLQWFVLGNLIGRWIERRRKKPT
jgi:hypothetical protein